MKKLLSIILSLVLLVSSLGTISISAADITITVKLGDVNASGDINNRDYALLMQYLNKWDVTLGAQKGDVSDIAGKTIKFASTIDPKWDETGPVVENFEKKYGVNVEIIACDLGNYVAQMQGLIAAGPHPTLCVQTVTSLRALPICNRWMPQNLIIPILSGTRICLK